MQVELTTKEKVLLIKIKKGCWYSKDEIRTMADWQPSLAVMETFVYFLSLSIKKGNKFYLDSEKIAMRAGVTLAVVKRFEFEFGRVVYWDSRRHEWVLTDDAIIKLSRPRTDTTGQPVTHRTDTMKKRISKIIHH